MSTQLHTAISNILAMPYYKNDHARSGSTVAGHEEAVALRLDDAGFTQYPKGQFPKLTTKILKEWASTGNDVELRVALAQLKVGSYILQPAGSQSFPDILVFDFNNRFVAIECKSTKGFCPMWNDNVPKPESIYVLSSEKAEATTIFMGRDVISAEEQALMNQQEAEISQIIQKYEVALEAIDVHKRGWTQKSRKQHFQDGGGALTNYFTHTDRAMCEKNALDYAKQ